MPTSYYDVKRLVSKLGLEVKKIDCCIRGCMLFYDNEFGTNDGELEECKFCESPRYLVSSKGVNQRQNRIAAKSMFYLPIIPRLQRMFASMHSASQMAWHHTNRISSGMMRHPSDGEAWKHFDRVHPEFALEPRNVRLGLCSDGFTPYNFSGNAYSCWPVIVTPYNLPPEMCMTKPYMFLTCIIPGPSSPKAGIDVYLQPLIDDLKRLWVGAWTYDVSRKQNFNMRAALMWTINDFPAYGMLSGWGTHGKMGCPHCMNHTKAFTLDFGGKSSWFDCHRRFLPTNHEFRRNKDAFRKGIKVKDLPPPRLSSTQVWNNVCDLPKFIDYGVAHRIKGYGIDHNWTKRSIFWDLPYWKDNLLRHNLDVMHIEKNFFDNVLNTVMDNEKTKDNEKARKDMELLCNRKELELKPRPNGKLLKPKACYTLTPQEAKAVCRWLNELRMPDGYSSNLARCADANTGKLHGMKSHDCHIFMERLLPIAFSSLPKNVLNPLTEIGQFFKDICASTLRVDDIIKLDRNIPVILCKLEQIFPPGFFDSMEHLPVHLAYEAFLGGPVQYRLMYPFERFMGDSKRSVKNKARVEGSICAHYIHRETSHFCSHYFNHMMLSPRIIRNEVHFSERSQFTLSVFGRLGRPAGKKSPSQRVNKWHTYFVNGYKFHTEEWSVGKKTVNSGVVVKGVTEGGEDDFYGVITHIYELVYNYMDSENKVFLFYCDWQVYYVPYPSITPRKREWCVVIKSNPMGHIETDELMEDVAYQHDEISPVNEVIETEEIVSLCDTAVEGQQVDASILLSTNPMEEEHEELEESGDNNIICDEDNEDYDDE
ncbi:uncharacterized protein LOC131651025 [Vicia villosa]|uniref:uncharacterized protein LOC131651025 n=1 Tax=Vicia villosa TaxID=3911 RepID=UPI00273AACF5|nr:uncharacterized protein LOC131651025 [Vicia villosa]